VVFFEDLDGVDQEVCFGESYNDLWPFLKDLNEFSLERLG